jgi:hypothetical protein
MYEEEALQMKNYTKPLRLRILFREARPRTSPGHRNQKKAPPRTRPGHMDMTTALPRTSPGHMNTSAALPWTSPGHTFKEEEPQKKYDAKALKVCGPQEPTKGKMRARGKTHVRNSAEP